MNTKRIVRQAFFPYADTPEPTRFTDNGGSSHHGMLIRGPWEEEVSTRTGRRLAWGRWSVKFELKQQERGKERGKDAP